MIRIAKISLDVRKDAVINNEPIILRQGENDVTIEATILNGGDETLQINFATFVAKKPDGTIVSNDPANINGSVISYPVSKHLTESVGKIQDAYFVINNKVTTCGFDISIIPSTQLDGTSVNYFPGLENINKFLKSTEADWLGRIQQMKSQIGGLDIPDEFKVLMDKALSDAKAQYQPIIDAAEANVENIVADLAAKKLDLTNNSDELNTTITAIKAQVASINSFLDNIQKQIIDANTSFTTGQQAQVSQSIADSQKKLADSIASMQSEVTQTIADLKNSSNSAITDMQNNQSTAMAKVNQNIADTEATIQKLQVSAVGTNLYQDTRDFDNPSVWTNRSYWQKTGDKFNGLTIMTSSQDFHGLYQTLQAKKGETYTFSVYARYKSGTGESAIYYKALDGSAGTDINSAGTMVSLNETWQRVTGTVKITSDGLIGVRIERAPNKDNTLLIAGPKLEKGPTATDYSLNPEDTATVSAFSKLSQTVDGMQLDISKNFVASKDGAPIYNAVDNTLDFNCYTDQAYLYNDGQIYQFPKNAKITINQPVSGGSSVRFIINLSTMEMKAIAWNTMIPLGWSELAAIRKTVNNEVLVTANFPITIRGASFKSYATVNAIDAKIKGICHRGFNRVAPEESKAAYLLAKQNGYLHWEGDINWTKDNVPMMIHDLAINRTGRNLDGSEISANTNITDILYKDLANFDFGIVKGERFKGEPLLTFEELVKLARYNDTFLHIEFKYEFTQEQVQMLHDIVVKYNMLDRIAWQAFGWDWLKPMMKLEPNGQYELLGGDVTDDYFNKMAALKTTTNTIIASQSAALSVDDIQKIADKGYPIYLWPVDDGGTVRKFRDIGMVEGIMTNGGINVADELTK